MSHAKVQRIKKPDMTGEDGKYVWRDGLRHFTERHWETGQLSRFPLTPPSPLWGEGKGEGTEPTTGSPAR